MTVYYFYLWDEEFGPGFIKLGSYFPFPSKLWCNGHEWAKRQASAEGLTFSELANGFASCSDPARLQAICDRLGPEQIQAFFDRWMAVVNQKPAGGLIPSAEVPAALALVDFHAEA